MIEFYQCPDCGHLPVDQFRPFGEALVCPECSGHSVLTKKKSVWRFMHFTTLLRPFNRPGAYMHRLQLIETPWFSVRLHVIRNHDEDKHLHDHPFSFVSFVLWGWYDERRGDSYVQQVRWFNKCPMHETHRIVAKSHRSVVTLVFTKGRARDWGYSVDGWWIQWQKYKWRQRSGLL